MWCATDGDDPYLVVAADKGTASFLRHRQRHRPFQCDFWLGDAFASGGSAGYDHKKPWALPPAAAGNRSSGMFREMNHDIQAEPVHGCRLSATCPAMSLATACCYRRKKSRLDCCLRSSRHLSSIPIPDAAEKSFAERQPSVRAAAAPVLGRTMTPRFSRPGRRRVLPHAQNLIRPVGIGGRKRRDRPRIGSVGHASRE